jgi:hypothetical protein
MPSRDSREGIFEIIRLIKISDIAELACKAQGERIFTEGEYSAVVMNYQYSVTNPNAPA